MDYLSALTSKTLITILSISNLLADEATIASEWVGCNQNSVEQINAELISKEISKIILTPEDKNTKLEISDVVNRNEYTRIIKYSAMPRGLQMSGFSNANRERFEDYVRLRMAGISCSLAALMISSSQGINWNGFKIPPSLLKDTSPPQWMRDIYIIPENCDLKSISDEEVTRYFFIQSNEVISTLSMDSRFTSDSQSLFKEKIIKALSKKKPETEESYFYVSRIATEVLETYGIRWIYPGEEPRVHHAGSDNNSYTPRQDNGNKPTK